MKLHLRYFIITSIFIVAARGVFADISTHDTAEINDLNRKAFSLITTDPAQSASMAAKAAGIASEINDQPGLGYSYSILGQAELNKGNTDAAMQYLQKSLTIRLQLNVPRDIAGSYNSIGRVYEKLDDYPHALAYYLKALEIRENNKLLTELPKSYNNLAFIHEIRGEYRESLKYYFSCIEAFKKSGDTSRVAAIYNNIGAVYKKLGETDSALYYFGLSLPKYLLAKDTLEISNTYDNIGATYIDRKEYQKALTYLTQALPLAEKAGSEESEMEIAINMGESYKGLRKFQTAQSYYLKALAIAEKNKLAASARDIYLNLAENYAMAGDYKTAYRYHQEYSRIDTGILNQEKNEQMADMLVKYKTKEKEKESLFYRQAEQMRSRQLLLVTAAAVLLVGALLFSFLFYHQKSRAKALLAKANEQMNRHRIDELLRQQELHSFQAMLEGQEQERKRVAEDLHDRLGILLSTIKLQLNGLKNGHVVPVGQQESFIRGMTLLDEACNEVRRIAHNMSSGLLTHAGLTSALNDLKEAIESSSSLKVNVATQNLDQRLDMSIEVSIYRMVQELLSNILKHAAATEVNINLNRNMADNIISVLVEDNGAGFDTKLKAEESGIGLKNISSRVSRLRGIFTLDSSKGRGTTAIIEIPLDQI